MVAFTCEVLSQEKKQLIELPELTLEQKWETAEGNLVYFIISGISFAKSQGKTAEDFGTFTGNVGCAYWKSLGTLTPEKFVKEISSNKQQFKDFQMEILNVGKSYVKGRMKGFGNNIVNSLNMGGVTEDDYNRFFDKKWEAIANCVNLIYKQEIQDDWTYFTITSK